MKPTISAEQTTVDDIAASHFPHTTSLASYAEDFKHTSFAKRLQDQDLTWIDAGAGSALAQQDFLENLPDTHERNISLQSIGYEFTGDNTTLSTYSQRKNTKFKYIETKDFQQIRDENYLDGEDGFFYELPSSITPKANLITDQRGVLSFVTNFSENLEKLLSLLESDGSLIFTLPKFDKDVNHFFEIVEHGAPLPLNEWFNRIQGVEMWQFEEREFSYEISEDKFGIYIIELKRNEMPIVVPKLKLVSMETPTSPPPKRKFISSPALDVKMSQSRFCFYPAATATSVGSVTAPIVKTNVNSI